MPVVQGGGVVPRSADRKALVPVFERAGSPLSLRRTPFGIVGEAP